MWMRAIKEGNLALSACTKALPFCTKAVELFLLRHCWVCEEGIGFLLLAFRWEQ